MTTKVARVQILKKNMFLHVKSTGLSDETLGSKIRRAIFRNSSVPVKKSHLSHNLYIYFTDIKNKFHTGIQFQRS